jgi:hypothetical protein
MQWMYLIALALGLKSYHLFTDIFLLYMLNRIHEYRLFLVKVVVASAKPFILFPNNALFLVFLGEWLLHVFKN